METYQVIQIKKSVYEFNDQKADLVRRDLKQEKVFLLNLLSSPGSGKTATVLRTIEALRAEMRIGVLVADLDAGVDARAVAQTGTKVVQVHSGGMCHLDAEMTRLGLSALGTKDLDLVILENIGNLICTVGFDVGACKNAMILSVPEGDDRPRKYPAMFSFADVLLINKIDAMEHFDFDLETVKARVKRLNPKKQVIPISARTGEGMARWANWIRSEVKNWKAA